MKVWDQNQEAIDFYEKRKFKIAGATNYAHGGLSDRVLMMENIVIRIVNRPFMQRFKTNAVQRRRLTAPLGSEEESIG